MIDSVERLKLADGVVLEVFSGRAVILSQETDRCFALDELGTKVIQLLDGRKGFDALVRDLLLEYDVSQAQLEVDLSTLIETLVSARLLTRAQV